MLGFEDTQEAITYLEYFEIPYQQMQDGRTVALIGKVKQTNEGGKSQMTKGNFSGKTILILMF